MRPCLYADEHQGEGPCYMCASRLTRARWELGYRRNCVLWFISRCLRGRRVLGLRDHRSVFRKRLSDDRCGECQHLHDQHEAVAIGDAEFGSYICWEEGCGCTTRMPAALIRAAAKASE